MTLGEEFADKELPYTDPKTGETKTQMIGNFLNDHIEYGQMRDTQPHNILLSELLPYLISPRDRVYKKNQETLIQFLKSCRAKKLEEMKQKGPGIDLFSILLSEGSEVYDSAGDAFLSEKTMFDDICFIYVAAVSTT